MANWPTLKFQGAIWLRTVVHIPANFTGQSDPIGLFLTAEASSAVWWDGKLLGHNGRPASTPELEQPGRLRAVFKLDTEQLKPGPHLLVMELSRQHGGNNISTPIDTLYLGPWQNPLSGALEYYLPGLISGGAVASACLFLLVTGWRGRDTAALWLSAACFALLLQLSAEALRAFVNYPYPWQGVRLHAVSASAWLFGFCLVGFLIVRVRIPHATRWQLVLGGFALLALGLPGDLATALVLLVFLGGGLFLAVRAAHRRQAGVVWLLAVLVLLLALLLLRTWAFLEQWLYVGFAVALMLFFADHLRVYFRTVRERDAARHTAARLELDLLKQHLKPHFLLNTLTALSEWVEESPRTAIRMVQTLGDEFRTLIDISAQPFITLDKELALCRMHLDVMSYRHDQPFTLRLDRDDGNPLIPPTVLHTLVENAVTHRGPTAANMPFLFTARHSGGGKWRLRLDCPAGADIPEDWQEGTGLAYVRARLVEAFGNDWRLTQGVSNSGGWFTEIEMPGEVDAACA
ncbi:MAG TPA: sensor histidine kinase [Gammaproteobacteria bacterium]|nr:sensor histidine kinase [Gammaproteobacteria bacterium]